MQERPSRAIKLPLRVGGASDISTVDVINLGYSWRITYSRMRV